MENKISDLFGFRGRKFEIPSYQRAYSWDVAQIQQFIEDIKDARDEHYLGHFLFFANKKSDTNFQIIDGQQRLTTTVIFFSALKDELEYRSYENKNYLLDIKNYYLKNEHGIQIFKTVEHDNNFFLDEIIDARGNSHAVVDTASKKRIREAKEAFKKEFKKASTDSLLKWSQLVENAPVTYQLVLDKIKATQIFAFQNDRGKTLSKLEIVKAFLMLQIYLSSSSIEESEEDISCLMERKDADIVYLENEFKTIYMQIVRLKTDEDDVLNYYWRAVSDKGYSSGEVIKEIKEKLCSITTDRTIWIKQFILGLSQSFCAVEAIEKSEESYTKNLFDLDNMALAFPFLIKASLLNVNEQSTNRLTKLLENITFRSSLRGGHADIYSRLNDYLTSCKNVNDIDQNITKIIFELKNSDYWSYWNDDEMNRYLNGYFYRNRVDNYLLWKYELSLGSADHPAPHQITFKELIRNESIEHIAPQTQNKSEPIFNGYGVYVDENDPHNGIVSGEWLNKLGNLMLMAQSQNSSLGNKPFSEKVKTFGQDNLLNQQKEIYDKYKAVSHPIWDKKSIEERQIKIIEAANRIWNLDSI